MRMMASFFSAYPGRTTVMLLALLLSGVAEGIGLSALLPLLNIAVGQDVSAAVTGVNTGQQNDFERTVLAAGPVRQVSLLATSRDTKVFCVALPS